MGGYGPPIRFGNTSGTINNQPPLQHPEFACDYQHVDKSHHDLFNLLTQQMTTILNPMMADHVTKFERLARQVERIARIVNYDEVDCNNVEVNPEDLENMPRNRDADIRLGGDIPRVVQRGQNTDKS
ncbi:hypothetical protein Ahy_A01g002691 [Arachis hypogaea]|uniref:Uncharacterized protein n=1 Tax=Arachis hypogaea TaxID=3818 RepID=A0A445ERF1_ARAHY|nr:hypothetical protein Ahy_A01g002691 [Arachis hypogaea]